MTETRPEADVPSIWHTTATGDPMLSEITKRIVATLKPVRVYLFGSRARGDNAEDSDYDVLVVVPTSTERSLHLEQQAHRSLHGVPASVDLLVWQRERFERQLVVVASLPAAVLREGKLLYEVADEKAGLTRLWLAKAQHSLAVAARAADGVPSLPDIAAFHCGHAAQKALNAFLTWHDQPLNRPRDLVDLWSRCRAIDPEFGSLEEAAITLSPCVAELGYPGSAPEPSASDSASAQHLAKEVVNVVLSRLPAAVVTGLCPS